MLLTREEEMRIPLRDNNRLVKSKAGEGRLKFKKETPQPYCQTKGCNQKILRGKYCLDCKAEKRLVQVREYARRKSHVS